MDEQVIKLLAIDDNRDNLTTLRAVLMDALPGCTLLTARDGLHGIELARAEDPDGIILDVVMPTMDGFEVCRRLKAEERLRDIPVVFLTALRADRASRLAALEAGAAGFLFKPLDGLELLAQVRSMTKLRAADRLRCLERDDLAALVAERTAELELELAERKRTEAQLEILSRIPEENPSPVLRVATDGRLLYANPASARLRESWSAECGDRVPADWVKHVASAMEADTCSEIELESCGRVYAFSLFPVCASEYVNIYGHDITQRRRAERERGQLEAQLRVSQRLEAIGSLAGGVAHDFNNLLSVILTNTDFALNEVPKDHLLAEELREVKRAAERAAGLTRQLLAFSRKQVLHPVALNLNRIAEDVEKMLRRIVGEDIELVKELAPDLGLTLADPGQIEQVLLNLVVNARDAMPGGGKLTLETANIAFDEDYAKRNLGVTAGPHVRISVADNGCGMDEQTLARLFEPFFTTKEQGKGTGLGLATVYGIVTQSGGSIEVESEPGKGATFRVYLPRAMKATEAVIQTIAVPRQLKGTETILVVEDEAALLKVARRALEFSGYTVLSADSGSSALQLAAEHPGSIDLLLTDVVMPKMSGRALAEAFARIRPEANALYMSGYTDDAIFREGVLDSSMRFLSKPFTAEELRQKVREVLDGDLSGGAGGR